MARKSEFRIIDGPSKFDLMAALFNRDIVQFTLEGAGESRNIYNANITGVQLIQEQYPETWSLIGRCAPYRDDLQLKDLDEDTRRRSLLSEKLESNLAKYVYFDGWYDGRRRNGKMTLVLAGGTTDPDLDLPQGKSKKRSTARDFSVIATDKNLETALAALRPALEKIESLGLYLNCAHDEKLGWQLHADNPNGDSVLNGATVFWVHSNGFVSILRPSLAVFLKEVTGDDDAYNEIERIAIKAGFAEDEIGVELVMRLADMKGGM